MQPTIGIHVKFYYLVINAEAPDQVSYGFFRSLGLVDSLEVINKCLDKLNYVCR